MTTAVEAPATTVAGPTLRSTVRSARGPVAVAVAAVLVVGGLALATAQGHSGALDPDAYDPAGARAVVQLLRGQGVAVERIGTVEELVAGSTTVLPFPDVLGASDLLEVSASGPVLAVAPGQESADALGLDLEVVPFLEQRTLAPSCSLPAAVAAGSARVGGTGYDGNEDGCYAEDGAATLVRSGDVTVVGSGDFLSNEHLDEDGNAALALGLLAPASRVQWLVPAAGTGGESQGLLDVLPDWVTPALVQLGVALVVLGLWRARRLGRVVTEPLPVVVRAAEAVEGRGRLYRRAGARDQAAEALRSASRAAAARRLGLGPGASAEAVVAAAAARTGQPPADLQALLYGPEPSDDQGLVHLAEALSRFDTSCTQEAS